MGTLERYILLSINTFILQQRIYKKHNSDLNMSRLIKLFPNCITNITSLNISISSQPKEEYVQKKM